MASCLTTSLRTHCSRLGVSNLKASCVRSVPAFSKGSRYHSHRASFPLERAAILEKRAAAIKAAQEQILRSGSRDSYDVSNTVRLALNVYASSLSIHFLSSSFAQICVSRNFRCQKSEKDEMEFELVELSPDFVRRMGLMPKAQ
jgi:hypothetical protein